MLDTLNQNPKAIIRVGCVSRQWGKTATGILIALSNALSKPKQLIRYGSSTKTQVKEMVLPTLASFLESCPKYIKPRKSDLTYTFHNGSEIHLVGVNIDKGDRLRGQTAHLVLLDEVREMEDIEYITRDIIIPQFTTTKGHLYMLSTPPESPAHPFTAIYIKRALETNSFYQTSYKTNPWLQDPEDVNRLLAEYIGGEHSVAWRREQLADYTVADLARLILPSFNVHENNQRVIEYNKTDRLKTKLTDPKYIRPYVGIDLGNRDHTAIIFTEYDELSNVNLVVAETYLTNPSTIDIVKAVMDGEEHLWSNKSYSKTVRYSDIDLLFINDLNKQYGLEIQTAVKKRDNTSMLARLNHSLAMGNTLIDPSTCKILTHECSTGVWNEKRTDFVRQGNNHMDGMAALKYIELMLPRRVQGEDINSLQIADITKKNPVQQLKPNYFINSVIR